MFSMLILASSSPRRLQLLQQISAYPIMAVPSEIDEKEFLSERPMDYARRMAKSKSDAIVEQFRGHYILSADTVVACGYRILPKAEDLATAHACLQLLSGRRHRVFGGICLRCPDGRQKLAVITTVVKFKKIFNWEIQSYLSSGEWQGKAGGYAIQGRAAGFVESINGCYFNVVGLSLSKVYSWLLPERLIV